MIFMYMDIHTSTMLCYFAILSGSYAAMKKKCANLIQGSFAFYRELYY